VVHERQGRPEEGISALRTAEELARSAGDVGTVGRALARRQFIRSHFGGASQAELQAEVEAIVPELEGSDESALAEVLLFLGVSASWLGHQTRAVELLERATAIATRLGDVRVAPEAASWFPAVMAYGPIPAEEVHRRWVALVDSMPTSRYARAFGDLLDALSIAMAGDIETARTQWRDSHATVAELGDEIHVNAATMQSGYIELLASDAPAAVEVLSDGERNLERLGEGGYRSTVLCLLADAHQFAGRAAEAIATSERAEGISIPDDFETNAGWRSARANALADLGRYEEAEAFARAALAVVEPTESLDTQARTWAGLGYVLASAGRTDEAVDAYREALERFERKGIVASSVRVERTMAVLRGEDPGPDELGPGAWGTTWPLRVAPS
jgi:tetratricopeptide (TPR) repeat protein